jgi:hypothetical protein
MALGAQRGVIDMLDFYRTRTSLMLLSSLGFLLAAKMVLGPLAHRSMEADRDRQMPNARRALSIPIRSSDYEPLVSSSHPISMALAIENATALIALQRDTLCVWLASRAQARFKSGKISFDSTAVFDVNADLVRGRTILGVGAFRERLPQYLAHAEYHHAFPLASHMEMKAVDEQCK